MSKQPRNKQLVQAHADEPVLSDPFYFDLNCARKQVYDKCGIHLTNLTRHQESADYGACSFELNGRSVQYRVSKITPAKTGQFVAIWKRSGKGITEPFDIADKLDYFIISSRNDHRFGQFIFPKSVLAAKGIITQKGREGKRGIRVYPPWAAVTNQQAMRTQAWQLNYFLDVGAVDVSGLDRMKTLLGKTDETE